MKYVGRTKQDTKSLASNGGKSKLSGKRIQLVNDGNLATVSCLSIRIQVLKVNWSGISSHRICAVYQDGDLRKLCHF